MTTPQNDVAELPALATKKQTAQWVGTTTRNIEIQVKAGRFPPPIRISEAPRWRRSTLLEWLDSQAMQYKNSQSSSGGTNNEIAPLRR
jgi:predicted DNA-binding transcriptional regulator AlpA